MISETTRSILQRNSTLAGHAGIPTADGVGEEILREMSFLRMLYLERKRSERSKRRFLLLLLDASNLVKGNSGGDALGRAMIAVARTTRETDIKGWYKEREVLGVVFTEIGSAAEGKAVAKSILGRITRALREDLSVDEINEIHVSFHTFPDDPNTGASGGSMDPALYPDLEDGKRAYRAVKRLMDITGSLSALTIALPLLIVIAIAIKLTSRGPILFRQERIRQHGRKFTFFKFRSMYFTNDHAIHEEYIKRLIAGEDDTYFTSGAQQNVYKLTNDPRITPIGKFLRKTSLDEVPQFLNVLRGEMSIVGPRPPVPYEFARYDIWHKARLERVKPGITGLWQVGGRSRVKFDDMVRMDLEYAKSWTPWMDLKIMFRTPGAMLFGDGAY